MPFLQPVVRHAWFQVMDVMEPVLPVNHYNSFGKRRNDALSSDACAGQLDELRGIDARRLRAKYPQPYPHLRT